MLSLATPGMLFALDPDKAVTQYSHDTWQDKDGLPQNIVQSITQTADGYLWVGTEVGLARFDGVRFVVFDKKSTPEIKNNNITALCAGRDGTLWIGTRGGGLTRLKDGKFKTYTKQNGLAHNTVRVIREDGAGNIWVGTNEGLSRLRDGKFVTYTKQNGLPADNVRAVYEDRSGALWIGTTDGLSQREGERFAFIGGVPRGIVRSIAEDRAGVIWVGTDDNGLYSLRDGGRETKNYTTKDGLGSNFVRAVHADAQGNLWVGTGGGGLVRIRRSEFSIYSVRDGFISNIVRAIYEDREGNLWVGTEGGGLSRFKNGGVTTYTTKEGLSTDFVRAIREGRNGALWVGTEGGGLNRLQDGEFTYFTTKDGLLGNVVLSLYEDREGGLWIGTEGGGLQHFKNGKLMNYTAGRGLVSNSVWAIEGDQEGSLWVGQSSGLQRLKDGHFTHYTVADGLAANFVKAIHLDHTGDLWIGFRGSGLTRLRNGRFTTYTTKDELPDANVSSFHEDTEGTLWIGTDGGLVRFRDDKFTLYTTREGLFNDNIYRVLEDGRARLWMSTSRGIFCVSKQELDNLANGNIESVTSIAYTTADGMKSNECTGDNQPAGWRTRDGKLWFPTVRGVVQIDQDRIETNAVPPPVHVEEIIVDKELIAAENIRLPPDTSEIEFHYTALSLVAPEKVRFKYKLEGLEQNWVDAGMRRAAYYTNLPPGDYRFRVMAANDDGVWNETGAAVSFYLQPHFYQTMWFFALCATGVIVLGFAAHRLRLKQSEKGMQREFAAVLAERNRIAREIHDTLLQGFAGTALQLNAVAHTLVAKPKEAKEQLDNVLDQVDVCLTEARHSVSRLRSPTLEHHDLVTAITKATQQLTANKPVRAQVAVTGTPKRLPEQVERNFLRIGQEAITNAVRHAEAEQIRIEITFNDYLVRLHVRDDGRGFDTQNWRVSNGEHFGLLGMRERAKVIGGKISLHSRPGEGTEVIVTVHT